MDNNFSLIYTTIDNQSSAEQIAKILLTEKLVACVNIIPNIKSLYMWNDKLEQGEEVIILMKNSANVNDKIIDRLTKLHPYDIPSIIVLPFNKGNEDYLSWITDNVHIRD